MKDEEQVEWWTPVAMNGWIVPDTCSVGSILWCIWAGKNVSFGEHTGFIKSIKEYSEGIYSKTAFDILVYPSLKCDLFLTCNLKLVTSDLILLSAVNCACLIRQVLPKSYLQFWVGCCIFVIPGTAEKENLVILISTWIDSGAWNILHVLR